MGEEIYMSEWEWLAGYLEGEGCFRMSGGRERWLGSPEVIAVSVDQDVMMRAARIMDTAVKKRPLPSNHLGSRPLWVVRVYGDRALRVMEHVLPYMGERRSAKIQEVLTLAAQRPGPNGSPGKPRPRNERSAHTRWHTNRGAIKEDCEY